LRSATSPAATRSRARTASSSSPATRATSSFHSHPETEARPSRTDIANIGLWASRPYLILSLARAELRAWRIEGGAVSEEQLTAT
jgi:proteasome lid subunit RPN8/RPN11